MKNKYTVDYFIDFLSAIPEEKWTDNGITSLDENGNMQHCVLGHVGAKVTGPGACKAAAGLYRLFKRLEMYPYEANDASTWNYGGSNQYHLLGDTPKQRVLAALELIKAGVKL